MHPATTSDIRRRKRSILHNDMRGAASETRDMMVLLISGQTQQGQRFARVMEGHTGPATVRVVSRASQMINAVRAQPPSLIILDLTTPCEITPAFVIATFFPITR